MDLQLIKGFEDHKNLVISMPVSELKPAHVMTYILRQKEKRSGYAANKDRKNLVAA